MNWERLTLAFRVSAYRWVWASNFAAAAGFQPFMIGQGWLLYDLTGSPFMVGLAPGLGAAFNLVLSPFWGLLADRFDRRKLMMISQTAMGLSIIMIGALVVMDRIEVWHVLGLSVIQRMGMSLQRTARSTLMFDVVGSKAFMNATAGQFLSSQGAGLIGPVGAGFIIKSFGAGYLFLILGFIILIGVLMLLKVESVLVKRLQSKSIIDDLKEGFRFVRNDKPIRTILWTVLVTEGLGFSTWSMFPVVAISLLGGDAVTLGLLGTFRGFGGVIGALFISSFGDIRFKGSILWGSAFLFGLFLIAFSFSHSALLSYVLISTIGFMAIMYNTQAQSLLQILTPDEMRGRVMGIHSVLLTGIGFGAMGMGAIAGWLGVNWAIFGGGGLVATNAAINLPIAPTVNRKAGGS